MDEENELDSMQGISDEKMTDLFNASIEIENEISRLKNVPIARYDVVQKKAYFEYPDGHIEYAKEAWNHSFCRAKRFWKNDSNKTSQDYRTLYQCWWHKKFAKGGHDVPADKVISRYKKAIELIPELVEICDICHIYDNSLNQAFRIFKKRKTEYFYWENELWNLEQIKNLVDKK